MTIRKSLTRFVVIAGLQWILDADAVKPFTQSHCRGLSPDSLTIMFSNTHDLRTITFNSKNQTITFKGTTYRDWKWRAPYSSIKTITLDEQKTLSLEFSQRHPLALGHINDSCEFRLEQHLKNQTPFSAS